MVKKPVRLLVTALLLGFCPSLLLARTITFEQRVGAQAAIERVYYSHQLGASLPFEQAVSRSLLERKVTTYLKQSAALEHFWHRPITSEMLQRELERMASRTRMPERLHELFAALGNDAFLIQECLARPALTARFLENYVAFDDRIQRIPRETAQALHEELSRGRRDFDSPGLRRSVVELVEVGIGQGHHRNRQDPSGDVDPDGVSRIELEPDAFGDWRKKLPDKIGQAGDLRQERDAFVTDLLMRSEPDRLRFIHYEVPKKSRSDWWQEVEKQLDPSSAAAVASETAQLPLIGSLSSQPCACGSADFWDNASLDDVPEPRMNHSSVWTGSLMVVWGGTVSFNTNTGGRYDPATDTWTPVSTLSAPAPREIPYLFWTGSRVLLWGGRITAPLSGATPINSGGLYDPVADSWSSISLSGAPPLNYLRDYSVVWTGSDLILWGGRQDVLAIYPYLNTGYRYNLSSNSWTATSTVGAPTGRGGAAAVWTGSEMILWSGIDKVGGLSDGARYNPASDTWMPISAVGAPSPSQDAFTAWTGSKVLVWTDYSGYAPADGGLYDPVDDSWSLISSPPAGLPQAVSSKVWAGNEMIVWGGYQDPVYYNTGARYDPMTNSWTLISTAGAPSPRSGNSAIWTGSEMIIWGGTDGSPVISGGRYNPTSNTWVPTSVGTAPSPRILHMAHWSGNLMLVWGGYRLDPGGLTLTRLNSGGRYDPALDAWTSTTTLGAPSPRSSTYSIWTGNKMIVWGGSDGSVRLASGGSYDPVADAWQPTSLLGAPTARTNMRMVWSGSRMLLWGGFDGTYANSGGRYDPISDTWTQMSQVNAPPGVTFHKAFWTGSRMLVWGGANATSIDEVATGGLYDPVSDSWQPTATLGAPANNLYGAAVWTGSEMIVWGGGDSGVYFKSGGRYSPQNDVWLPTPTANAPKERASPSAIWTGTRLIVWGGYNDAFESGDPFLQTGGIYDPISNAWNVVATIGAPFGRTDHTAVWTGEKMVAWGGQVSNSYSSGGGMYCGVFAPHYYQDNDTDGFGNSGTDVMSCSQPAGYVLLPGDCSDNNAAVWSTPSQVLNVQFANSTTLQWSAPAQPGATSILYDAIRSGNPADFVSGASCLATDTASLSASDATVPALGTTLNYLVRAQDGCPSGVGSLGTASSGIARAGLNCP